MTKTDFLARHCADFAPLARAVIRQSGGWRFFKQNAPDISNHGIDVGFSDWIYYSDTVAFFRKNRALIVDWLSQTADDLGCEVLTMLASWRCLQGCSQSEILATIAGTEISDTVANGLAWGVAEDFARRFVDACED